MVYQKQQLQQNCCFSFLAKKSYFVCVCLYINFVGFDAMLIMLEIAKNNAFARHVYIHRKTQFHKLFVEPIILQNIIVILIYDAILICIIN